MMREILFRGKSTETGKWREGYLLNVTLDGVTYNLVFGDDFARSGTGVTAMSHSCVYPETVGQFTGVYDTEVSKIFEGDVVRFLHYVGTVVFEEGCFGIAISCNDAFDWDYIDEEMKEYAGTNQITACFNDHFISLWEILWNFNCDQNVCNVIEVIGNIHDNPELLEGGADDGN